VFLLPAILQLVFRSGQFLELLSDSGDRASDVPITYYVDKLVPYEGPLLPLVWLAGLVLALRRRRSVDILLVIVATTIFVFYQLYPLKAYNYLLPVIPPLAVMAGEFVATAFGSLRAFGRGTHGDLRGNGTRRRARRSRPIVKGGLATALLLSGVLVGSTIVSPMAEAIDSMANAGLREAGAWMRWHLPREAALLTLSNGSAQHVFSFYARRDAYPFGRFRLATVLPGGEVVDPRPIPPGQDGPPHGG